MEREELEAKLAEALERGEIQAEPTKEAVRRKLPPRTVYRVQAQRDPVAEETKRYRRIAKEIDDRYARYDDSAETEKNE